MKLQIACDMTDVDLMWKVLDATHDLIDIIELGNIGQYEGARIIPMVKERYPECEIMWARSRACFIPMSQPLNTEQIMFPLTQDQQMRLSESILP